MKVVASIYVGSYATSLKVFEIIKNKHIRQVEHVRARIGLLEDIHRHGGVSGDVLERLAQTLRDFYETARMYRADEITVNAGYSLSSADNAYFIVDRIKNRTGISLHIMDNAAQRYLIYRAIASGSDFEEMIGDRTVLVDIGGSSIQLSLFHEGSLINSQHIFLGATNVADHLRRLDNKSDYREQLLEMLHKEISVFYNMFLKQIPPNKLVIVHNHLLTDEGAKIVKKEDRYATKEYLKLIKQSIKHYYYNVADNGEENEFDSLRLSYLLLYQSLMERLPVTEVYAPFVSVHEGVAYAYAHAHNLIKPRRDFEKDVLTQSWAIAERYNSYQPHLKALERVCEILFDAMKKWHGLKSRDKLLLRVCAILHDCGKYISIAEAAQCSYTIIRSSEILGLSEKERQMIAQAVYFHRKPFLKYAQLKDAFSEEEYFTVLKFASMLRVANALDKSHKQKAKHIKMHVNTKDELIITMDAEDSLTLERGLFEEKTRGFIDTFGIRPVIKERKL